MSGAGGRAALVTGGGRGIGRAIALALAEAGFAVAINDLRHDADVATTLDLLAARGVRAGVVLGDVAEIGWHAALLDAAEAAVGKLTTLVNNAGVPALQRGDLLDVSAESFDRCHAVNARATFFLTQQFARRLLARTRAAEIHHAIITVTSSSAQAVSISRGEYCASKAAAAMGVQLFAVRLAPEGIGAYDIQPGIIETAMTAAVRASYARRIAEGLTPLPRMGQPEDVARVAVALARGDFAFAVGQVVQADGGLLIRHY